VRNLIVAGRCISVTHEAAAAIRVTPIAMAIGQAAGTAAAICTMDNTDPSDICIDKLRTTLKNQGAVV